MEELQCIRNYFYDVIDIANLNWLNRVSNQPDLSFLDKLIWNKLTKITLLNISFDLEAVCPDWAIYWTLGNFLKPLTTINLPKFL